MTEWGETVPKLMRGGWRLGTQERARRAFTLLAPQKIYSIVLPWYYVLVLTNNRVILPVLDLARLASPRERSPGLLSLPALLLC